MSRLHARIGFLAAIAIGGCADSHSGASVPSTAREILAVPARLGVKPADTDVRLDATIDRGGGAQTARVALPATGGFVELAAVGDQLALRGFEIDFAPIDIPVSIVPSGLRLVDVRIRLEVPPGGPIVTTDAAWSDDGESCVASAVIGLVFDWSIDTGSGPFPLASQRIADVSVALAIGRDGDAVTANVDGMAPGVGWSWADIVVLGGLTMSVTASS